MRTTSAIAFYCRQSKTDRNGYAPLEVSISICGSRKLMNLPMKFKPTDFNRKRPPQEIIEALDVWRNRIESYKTQILKEGRVLTAETLRSVIQSGGINAYTIGNLFEDYLHILSKRVGVDLKMSVYRKYELVYEKVLHFVNKDDEVSKLTPQLIKTIEVTWRPLYDPSTLAGYLTRLKTFVRFAIDNGKLQINPFQGIRITKPIKPIKALTQEQVDYLLTLSLESRLQRVLDLFLIQCGTGFSYSDLMAFNQTDLKKEGDCYYISKNRVKTGKPFTAIVLPFALPIIFHYKELPKISNQKYNKYLKEINPTLTSHMGRRTFASILANKNVSPDTIASALGDTTQIAMRYYAKILPQTIIKQLSTAIN